MKRYISWSELYTFYEKGEQDYFRNYILGIREPPSEPMIYGKIVHEALADDKYDWKKELIKQGFTSDKERITKKILAEVPRCRKREVGIYVDTDDGFQIYMGLDGVDNNFLTEFKTGQIWTKERADEHKQITMYTLAWFIQFGVIMPFRLITISSTTGKHKILWTERTPQQLNDMMNKLKQFKAELEALNWWLAKVKMDERIEL